MESIYYVITWLCHRTCRHCYEDRFRPYRGEDLQRVVEQSRTNVPRIVSNLPARMTYRDAGGEVMLEPIRSTALYPAIDLLHERYRAQGGIKVVVQTTGDTLTPGLARELLDRRVWNVSVSGLDEYHDGVSPDALRARLAAVFEAEGARPFPGDHDLPPDSGPFYSFFGATPDSWIGRLWPRGRAMSNELSTAGITDNFCNGWSGGLNFLQHHQAGSEVSIDPEGNVFPCCIKTRLPAGNILHRTLDNLLDSLAGDPVYEAITMGHPERMGIRHGWTVEKFLEKCETVLPSGRVYRNLCVGCDRFHDEVLAPLVKIDL